MASFKPSQIGFHGLPGNGWQSAKPLSRNCSKALDM